VPQETLALRMDNWLHQVGFVNGNPFATSEADREGQYLPEFFVDTGHYDLICGDVNRPQTALVFAPRGGGKTAYRVMLQRQCCPHQLDSTVLAVSYTSFEPALASFRERRQVSAEAHVRAILRSGLSALLNTLCWSQERARAFPSSQRSCLAWFLRTFDPPGLSAGRALACIQSIEKEFDPPWEPFQRSVQEANLGQELAHFDLLENPSVRLLADIVDGTPEPLGPQASPAHLIAEFVALTRAGGMKATYVLVDRVDELMETAEDTQMILNLLPPLLADLKLMEVPDAAFKVFLPRSVLEPLRACRSIRFDRLRVYEIEWNDSLLAEMMSRRLIAYSGGRVRSLSKICTSPLSESIDQEIVHGADGSPRHLLRLGELLFLEHVTSPSGASLLLSRDEWDRARAAFLKEHLPLLRVDASVPQAFVGRRRIALTPLEHRFLLALCQGGGWCEKENLIVKVWEAEEGVSDQAVSRLVRRVREKIEPYPGEPIYLITEHGLGFRLENVVWAQTKPGLNGS